LWQGDKQHEVLTLACSWELLMQELRQLLLLLLLLLLLPGRHPVSGAPQSTAPSLQAELQLCII
jgi:hypothetical protein